MARKSKMLAALAVAAGLLVGAGGAEAAEQAAVRVGMTPFFDYQFFSVAKEYRLGQAAWARISSSNG